MSFSVPIFCDCFHTERAESNWYNRDVWLVKTKISITWIFTEREQNQWCLDYSIFYLSICVYFCKLSKSLSCVWFLRPQGLWPTRLLCPWDSPGKNTGVGYHFLLQGIFLTQRLNLHPLHWGCILYHWATRDYTVCSFLIGIIILFSLIHSNQCFIKYVTSIFSSYIHFIFKHLL